MILQLIKHWLNEQGYQPAYEAGLLSDRLIVPTRPNIRIEQSLTFPGLVSTHYYRQGCWYLYKYLDPADPNFFTELQQILKQ
jgi:hypothetical protein